MAVNTLRDSGQRRDHQSLSLPLALQVNFPGSVLGLSAGTGVTEPTRTSVVTASTPPSRWLSLLACLPPCDPSHSCSLGRLRKELRVVSPLGVYVQGHPIQTETTLKFAVLVLLFREDPSITSGSLSVGMSPGVHAQHALLISGSSVTLS